LCGRSKCITTLYAIKCLSVIVWLPNNYMEQIKFVVICTMELWNVYIRQINYHQQGSVGRIYWNGGLVANHNKHGSFLSTLVTVVKHTQSVYVYGCSIRIYHHTAGWMDIIRRSCHGSGMKILGSWLLPNTLPYWWTLMNWLTD